MAPKRKSSRWTLASPAKVSFDFVSEASKKPMMTTLSDLLNVSKFSGVTSVTAGRDCLIMYDTIASALRAPWYGDDSGPRNT